MTCALSKFCLGHLECLSIFHLLYVLCFLGIFTRNCFMFHDVHKRLSIFNFWILDIFGSACCDPEINCIVFFITFNLRRLSKQLFSCTSTNTFIFSGFIVVMSGSFMFVISDLCKFLRVHLVNHLVCQNIIFNLYNPIHFFSLFQPGLTLYSQRPLLHINVAVLLSAIMFLTWNLYKTVLKFLLHWGFNGCLISFIELIFYKKERSDITLMDIWFLLL